MTSPVRPPLEDDKASSSQTGGGVSFAAVESLDAITGLHGSPGKPGRARQGPGNTCQGLRNRISGLGIGFLDRGWGSWIVIRGLGLTFLGSWVDQRMLGLIVGCLDWLSNAWVDCRMLALTVGCLD